MKKYRIEEITKMWRDGKRLTFKCRMYGSIILRDEGIEFKFAGGHLPLGSAIIKQEWELIQEPVPFMEAVKAYSEGKTIRCEANGSEYIFNGKCHRSKIGQGAWFRSERDTILSTEMILNGTWYVEDGDE